MALPLQLARTLATAGAREAWAAIFKHAWETCSKPLSAIAAAGEITKRDRETGTLDLYLAAAGWDLWKEFEASAPTTADALAAWWAGRAPGRGVLILDGLSLREVPWLLHEAAKHGYKIHDALATASELPGETSAFAHALGFSGRAALENNGGGSAHRLPRARTETLGIPWADAANAIDARPDWVLWHHWPDNRVHDLAAAGQGLEKLTVEVAQQLGSDAFWDLVKRLSTGRRLIITSDHGYAATGLFADAPDEQAKYLKDVLKSGRCAPGIAADSPWVPPVDLSLTTKHGAMRFALGRRKWKSQGGYPTLTHGGLTVLEVASPFIELSRAE
jgi:hypothetical protein